MSALGWKFEQAYVKVSGSSGNGYGSTSSTTHYLLSKDVDSIQEINNIIDEIKAKKLLNDLKYFNLMLVNISLLSLLYYTM